MVLSEDSFRFSSLGPASHQAAKPQPHEPAAKLQPYAPTVTATVQAGSLLEAGIDGFAFEGENAEHAFVNAPQGLFAHEALQGLDAEREFPERE